MNVQDMQALIDTQKHIIQGLQHEVQWLEGIIDNPSYNETDMRFLVVNTPREIKCGFASTSDEFPERKEYMPAQAEKLHASDKTAGKVARKLADAGLFSYRTTKDPDTGNTRVHMAAKPQLADAPVVEIPRAKRGGSTWEDGKRVKYCSSCGSTHLVGRKQIKCEECGAVTADDWKPVNPSEDTPNSQDDCWSPAPVEEYVETSVEEDTPNSQDDCWSPSDSASDEVSKVPSLTVSTLGISMERLDPPTELQELKQWIVWKYEEDPDRDKPRKVPYQPGGRSPQRAKTNDPETWGTYEQALKMYEESHRYNMKEKWDGIGFMFANGYAGIDFDHCVQDGQITLQVWERIQAVFSYSELSPSGTGVHCIAKGVLPGKGCNLSDIEMYCEGRYFTWTGKHIIGTPTMIEARQEQLTALYTEIKPPTPVTQETEQHPNCAYSSSTCSDDEVLEKARNAGNGAKFRSLYDEGDISVYQGDDSRADMGLCRMLAYWTNGDEAAIDRLFRQSALMRDKWDRNAGAGVTYGELTISHVLGAIAA